MEFENLKKVFLQQKEENPRLAAEVAYAIAAIAKRKGKNDEAVKFGNESMRLLDEINGQTQVECATHHVFINGVFMPEFIHSGVVRKLIEPVVFRRK